MRLKTFLLQEGRSKEISEEEAINLIKKNCQQALKGTPIYRGIRRSSTVNYMFIDPKSGKPRVSANTRNYYTLINDNSPYWKQYPKRSRSIICTTDSMSASRYGWVKRVFPYDGAKIGVCPERDYWLSFQKILGEYITLDEFNNILYKLINTKANIYGFNDSSYKNIVESFKTFDMFMKDSPKLLESIKNEYPMFKDYDPEKITFLEYVQKLLSPKPNGFKLKKSGDKLPREREVWTDSKSVLVADVAIEDILDELQ
jgi:hypothetical protein